MMRLSRGKIPQLAKPLAGTLAISQVYQRERHHEQRQHGFSVAVAGGGADRGIVGLGALIDFSVELPWRRLVALEKTLSTTGVLG
jgi:hypothetical protein